MKKLFSLLCAAAMATAMTAQTAREEILANRFLAGSNYLDYDRQLPDARLTPAPKGYTPFYMSHYGRHGSRWLISKDSYTSVTEPLQKARQAGKLTAKGEETLRLIEQFVASTPQALPGPQADIQQRLGDLTTVGERQHHGIARRMVSHFPELFRQKGLYVDARSTVVNRCILSMTAECEELAAANPTAHIHNDVSEDLQYYLNQPRSGLIKNYGRKGRELRRQQSPRITTDRIIDLLFSDKKWARDNVKAWDLVSNLFEVATNMQSHDGGTDLYPLFTDDELYELWRQRNIGWYLDYGAAPQTGGIMPFAQRNLLRNIIESADTVSHPQAALRFGHEVCVMPLACLMELGDCGASVSDLDQLDAVWRNYRIFPMACNIQLVFYAKKKSHLPSLTSHLSSREPLASHLSSDPEAILVKALLNEREVRLPIATDHYPYYRWSELRQYYLDKLAKFDEQERQFAATQQPVGPYDNYYKDLPVALAKVSRPSIPSNSVNLRDFGAVGDGQTLCSEAFQKAISRLKKMGGGRLVVPQGVWLTGPIKMDNYIDLHLEKNAIIYFSPDKRLYVPAPEKKSSRMLACIYASRKHDIAITGEGIIDGNGQQWRPVKRSKVSDVEWKQYKAMGGVERDKGSLWYPWQMNNGLPDVMPTPEEQEKMRNDLVRFTDCENLLFEGVTFQNAPKFHVHPLNCENVVIDGITVRCPWNAQNGDAIDISDCHRVLIVGSTVDAGDDGLCMKSGLPKEGHLSGVEDVLIQDNTVYHAHGAFVLGSETAGGVRRIVVRNCRFSGTDTGLRFKSGLSRGGKTEQLYIQDCVMTDIAQQAIVFQCDYVDRPAGSDPKATPTYTEEQRRWAPNFQDIHISGITCRGVPTAIQANGILGLDCIHDVDISNSTFIYNKVGQQIDERTARISLNGVNLVKDDARQ